MNQRLAEVEHRIDSLESEFGIHEKPAEEGGIDLGLGDLGADLFGNEGGEESLSGDSELSEISDLLNSFDSNEVVGRTLHVQR